MPEVGRKAKLVLLAFAGAATGAVLARRRRPAEAPAVPDERTEELRRKLEGTKGAVAPAEPPAEPAEPHVEPAEPLEPPMEPAEPSAESPEPPAEPEPVERAEPPAAEEPAPPGSTPPARARPAAGRSAPPQDEFEAMRRRIHEEGRAAAEEMRRSANPPDER